MYYASAQGVDECMINVHYYYACVWAWIRAEIWGCGFVFVCAYMDILVSLFGGGGGHLSQSVYVCTGMHHAQEYVCAWIHARIGKSVFQEIIIIMHSFYITLFSALQQTHCAHWHVILNERLYPFIACIINIHGNGVLVALFGCCMAGATWNATISAHVLCTPFNHAPANSVTSFKAT